MKLTIDASEVTDLAEDIEHYGEELRENIDAVMEFWADEIKVWLEASTPRGESGLTAASWTVVPIASGEFYITNSNEPIITYLLEGTSEHFVAPVTAKALHWVDPETGADRFSMGHWVRGIVGYDFVTDILNMLEPQIQAMLDIAEDAAWRAAMNE